MLGQTLHYGRQRTIFEAKDGVYLSTGGRSGGRQAAQKEALYGRELPAGGHAGVYRLLLLTVARTYCE